jgi:hypothetical protein
MVKTNLSPSEVRTKANSYFTSKNYSLVSQTDTQIVYEDGKDVSTLWLILGILFLLIGAIIYYLLAKKHSVTILISGEPPNINVEAISNSKKSLTDGNAFLSSL